MKVADREPNRKIIKVCVCVERVFLLFCRTNLDGKVEDEDKVCVAKSPVLMRVSYSKINGLRLRNLYEAGVICEGENMQFDGFQLCRTGN